MIDGLTTCNVEKVEEPLIDLKVYFKILKDKVNDLKKIDSLKLN